MYRHRISHRLKIRDAEGTELHKRKYSATPAILSGKFSPIATAPNATRSLSPVGKKDILGAKGKLDISVCPIYAI